jgi:hypothetical protein
MKLFIILLLCILPLQASGTQDVTWKINAYYEDTSNKLSINAVLTITKQNQFENYLQSDTVFSKGYTKSTYWIKVLLHNATPKNAQRGFQLDHSWLDEIDLYLVQDTHILHQWMYGDKRPYNLTYNKSLHPHIKLNIPSGTSILYLKVSSEEPLIVPFTIDTLDNTTHATLIKLSFFAAIYAAVFIMALYHLFLFFSIREKNYLFYTLF